MVDYDRSTGNSGTMRIRDTGSVIEFWISSGNSTTYNYDMPWAYVVNGVSSAWREYRYEAGSGFEKLGSWTITTSQTVTFKLGDTGTSGLGGPTNHSVFIERAKAPNHPSKPNVSVLSSTSVHVTFSDGDDNGATIDQRQIGYGTSSSTVQFTVSSDRSTDITGLTPGTKYYFWARTHNEKGWGGWSVRSEATTWDVPDAPSSITLSEITQTTLKAAFVPNYAGGTAVLEYQIGYGTHPNTAQQFIDASGGDAFITGLSPGIKYYFWARARNSVGWSNWSFTSSTYMVAGARVKVGFLWKPAVPYVRVNGVWKLARPWGRIAGVWKEVDEPIQEATTQ